MIQVLSSRRSPSVYKVTNSLGKVVNLCLFKTSYRLGDSLTRKQQNTWKLTKGFTHILQAKMLSELWISPTPALHACRYASIDISSPSFYCLGIYESSIHDLLIQYSVTLQSEECIDDDKRRRTGPVAAGDEMVVSHSKHHEVSVGFLQTHICLPVPLHVTPTFATDLVSLKWRLHFEFVTTTKQIEWNDGGGGGSGGETAEWQPPRVVDIETMVWDFPIVIYPTASAHVSKALYAQRDAKIAL